MLKESMNINKHLKLFTLFCCITTQLDASARLTKENLYRQQHGLPLLPDFTEPEKRRPLTRAQQYDVGITYLRHRKTQEVMQRIDKFFSTLQKFYHTRNQRNSATAYTHYEQEKLHRTDDAEIKTSSSQNYIPLHKYQNHRQSRKKS